MDLIAAKQSRGSNSKVSVPEESCEQWESMVLGAVEMELVFVTGNSFDW